MGQVQPQLIERLNLETGPVFAFEIRVAPLLDILRKPTVYTPVSTFPTVNRDLNFILDESVPAAQVVKTMYQLGRELIRDVRPVDIYRHPSLGQNKKSVLFNLVFQSNVRTLEDKEVNSIISEIIRVVSEGFQAKLRA
jgi:phenylalanyl-tRNA synthetase beta chain